MKKIFLSIIFIFLCANTSFSLSDYDYKKMMKNPNFAEADEKLNQVWNELKHSLPTDVFEILKENQLEWINSGRDIEARKFMKFYSFVEAYTKATNLRAKILPSLAEELSKPHKTSKKHNKYSRQYELHENDQITKKSTIPYDLSWGMTNNQVKNALIRNGFKYWDSDSDVAKMPNYDHEQDERMKNFLESLGITEASFKNSDTNSPIRLYATFYEHKLYSFALRYSNSSKRSEILNSLTKQFGSTGLEFSENGISVYCWKTDDTLISFSFAENNKYITRLAYTDLITKQKFGLTF